jgi:hypothetical protein
MQVAALSDAITHAVIGKQESVEMGVSDSAALMHIFSTTLYTYPRLATVREIICNGWDGHITANKTDTPLQIILKDGQLSIRDFGPGIPHAKIGQIYGVFGNSTKREDSTVTGGFGLGSKAPLAYVDNFEVISHNSGVKTVYRVSKSSMEKGGKPSIDTIVSMPTTETGIQVKLGIQHQHADEFLRLINEVLILGEIKASVNGKDPVEGLPLENSPTGYLINSFSGTLTSRINVRYGNVVYPLPKHEGYLIEWQRVLEGMSKLWNGANIIFMCAPDTVSIAPSREALILTDATVATLKGLLLSFDSSLAEVAKVSSQQIIQARTNKLISEETIVEPSNFANHIQLPRITSEQHPTGIIAYTTRRAFLNHELQRSTSVSPNVLVVKRLEKLVKEARIPVKFGNALLKKAKYAKNISTKRSYFTSSYEAIIHKYLTLPLNNLIAQDEKLTKDRLYYTFSRYSYRSFELIRPSKLSITHGDVEKAVSFAFKRAVVGRSKTAIQDFLSDQEYPNGWVAYLCQNNEKTIQAITDGLVGLGYDVRNVIPEKVVEEIDPLAPKPVRKPAAPKRKGFLSLLSSFNPVTETFLLSTARANATPESEVHDPVAYVVLNNSTECPTVFSKLSGKSAQLVATHFGDKIAVVISTQVQKLIDKGMPEVSAFIGNYVDAALSTRPDFPRYLAFGKLAKDKQYRADTHKFLGSIIRHEKVMSDLGLRFYITPETDMLITFYEESQHRQFYALDLPKCRALVAKVKPYPGYDTLVHKIDSSPWKYFLDMDHVVHKLDKAQPSSEHYAIACEIALKLLK